MHKHHTPYIPRPQKEKGSIPSKHSRISELHQAAHEGGYERRVRMRECVFVEMVNVCYSEVEGGGED